MYFTRARIERFVEWGVLALLVAAALWRGGKGLEATWLLAGAAVIATFSSTKRVSATPGVWISLMLFVLWTVLSYLLSTTGNYGLDEVLRDTSLVLVFLWAVPLLEKGWDAPFARRLVTVLAITTLVCCAVGVAVYIFQPVNRFVGSFFYYRFSTDYWPNAWAEFVLLTWPVVMLWSRKFPTWLRVLLLGGVLGCLFLSFSRGAFLVFIVQIVLLASMRPRALLPLIGSGIIAVALFLGINAVRAGFHDVESVSAKATFTSSEGSSSISERRAFWEQSLRLSLVHPVVGWGPYSFRFIQPRLQTEVFATSDHPHNVFLKLALERGWPGMLFYLFALVGILVPAGVALLRRKRNDLILFAFIGIVGVFTHNLIDYNLQFVGIALPLWLFLAAVTASRTPAPSSVRWMRVCQIVLAAGVGIVAVLEARMLVLSSLGRHAEAIGDSAAALSWYGQAEDELFSRDMHLSEATLHFNAGEYDQATQALERYRDVNRQDARVWILQGNIDVARGNLPAALAEYEVAVTLGKYNYLEPVEGMLQILDRRRDPAELARDHDMFQRIFTAFGNAILQNAHFIALSGNVETFGRVSTLLQKFYPADRVQLRTFTKKVLDHAQEERDRANARAPGLLW